MKARALVSIATTTLVLAGCGGSSPQFTEDSVSASMTEALRTQLEKQGGTMNPLECFKDGDEYHWQCRADGRKDGQHFAFTVAIVCDADTSRCLAGRADIQPG